MKVNIRSSTCNHVIEITHYNDNNFPVAFCSYNLSSVFVYKKKRNEERERGKQKERENIKTGMYVITSRNCTATFVSLISTRARNDSVTVESN